MQVFKELIQNVLLLQPSLKDMAGYLFRPSVFYTSGCIFWKGKIDLLQIRTQTNSLETKPVLLATYLKFSFYAFEACCSSNWTWNSVLVPQQGYQLVSTPSGFYENTIIITPLHLGLILYFGYSPKVMGYTCYLPLLLACVYSCHVSVDVLLKYYGGVAVVWSECFQGMTHQMLGYHRSPLHSNRNLLRYLTGHAVDAMATLEQLHSDLVNVIAFLINRRPQESRRWTNWHSGFISRVCNTTV